MKFVMMAIAALLIAPVTSASLHSETNHHVCHGFMPDNNWSIPDDFADANTGITQVQFNAVATRITQIYTQEVAALGGQLQIRPLWKNATVNSSADEQGKLWIVNMYGGLARYHGMTPDAEALVACHEMGHHLGGAPKFALANGTPDWAAVEGAADYFASLKCIRRYFAADSNNLQIVRSMRIDPTVQAGCGQQYSNPSDQAICARAAQAGLVLATILHDLGQEPTQPAFNTPDQSVVKQTNPEHPASQCRLDTYFEGSLCQAPVSTPMSNTDYTQGSCSEAHGDKIGNRPKCWFNANVNNGNPAPVAANKAKKGTAY